MFRLILLSLYTFREGRWKLKYEEQQINKCVLWANEDNCGCCNIELPTFDETLGDDFYLPYVI